MTRQIPYQIRNAYRDEWDDAMTLAWKTFMKFEADIYTDEGIVRLYHGYDVAPHVPYGSLSDVCGAGQKADCRDAYIAEQLSYLPAFCR